MLLTQHVRCSCVLDAAIAPYSHHVLQSRRLVDFQFVGVGAIWNSWHPDLAVSLRLGSQTHVVSMTDKLCRSQEEVVRPVVAIPFYQRGVALTRSVDISSGLQLFFFPEIVWTHSLMPTVT